MNTFGFIGMGNMGNAMLNGLLKEVPAHAIRFTDASEVVRVNVSNKTGVASIPTNIELANSVKYIILAVKPQCYEEVIRMDYQEFNSCVSKCWKEFLVLTEKKLLMPALRPSNPT